MPVVLQRLGVVPREVPDVGKGLTLLGREGFCHFVLARAIGHVVFGQVADISDV